MKFYNIKYHNEQVNFYQAVKDGLGSDQGLYFPKDIPEFTLKDINTILKMDFVTRSSIILSKLIGNEIPVSKIHSWVKTAFNFPVPVKSITTNIAVLELFYGPTLAFKDFGVRFMAKVLADIHGQEPITILTATSGDTGAAVAHAFYEMKKVRVVILYPCGRLSRLQEQLFCTLGKNIQTISVDGDFDTCQQLVKTAFNDELLKSKMILTSANSINISRLIAQICYYFEALAQLLPEQRSQLVISVPSGNFGNLTAGLLAKSMGLNINRFIAATNSNDTVARFLQNRKWSPKITVTTLATAMDISKPNNWPRIETLFRYKNWSWDTLTSYVVDDDTIKKAICNLAELGYISEPHTAIAWHALKNKLHKNEYGLFLSTAHPAKFQDCVELIIKQTVPLPKTIAKRANLTNFSHKMTANYDKLRRFLLSINK
ncbi:MAG: threonine synthase [Candidatus Dasytiphilus stammeri]